MDIKSYSINWHYPTSMRVGAGRIRELAQACSQLGMEAPLLVTDPALATLPMIADALQLCRDSGLRPGLFSAIKSNPTGANVAAGVVALKNGGHDGVIAFGGGSAIDAGKAIALIAQQNCTLWEAQNPALVDPARMFPLVAVPTTAGTGSEVGQAVVISDDESHLKRVIFHLKMMPPIVILDPQLTLGLPPQLTAATGMDALAHNLEGYCTPLYHPMAEGIALEGVRLVKEHLPRAVHDGNDIHARLQMQVASSMGATAFQRGLGALHALSHSLGALSDAHHGLLNGILMPYVLLANRSAIEDEMQRLARYLDLRQHSFAGVLEWILDLRAELGIPHSLAELNIDAGHAESVGLMSARDVTARTNAVALDAGQYQELFLNALKGSL